MKIIDVRDGTTLEGELVATILAGTAPTERQLKDFYKCTPLNPAYSIYEQPMPYDRVVLQRGDPEDQHYFIVPKYEFYKEQ